MEDEHVLRCDWCPDRRFKGFPSIQLPAYLPEVGRRVPNCLSKKGLAIRWAILKTLPGAW
ncbi:unnamed protein product [Prorocentrum cordatum]|uniref:Uncharacterized protein n=1 Tax=Prorocentrum cordatum TaxID=2364126 RepID=A0ABN9TCD6_9DINO|nr:unnamed protein product [Polarella glacialis]